MKTWVIIGATSAIAKATAEVLAKRGDAFVLASRNTEKMTVIENKLTELGSKGVTSHYFDVCNTETHKDLLAFSKAALGEINGVLVAHGKLPEQEVAQQDALYILPAVHVNACSTACVVEVFAQYFEERRSGVLAVITSVAGDRGRLSNYIYGSSKAMITTYLQGVRQRLQKSKVQVLTIKPGFVDTPMTSFKENKGLLWASPETIGKGIVSAIDREKDVVYLPGYWRLIMMLVRLTPEFIFKRLNL